MDTQIFDKVESPKNSDTAPEMKENVPDLNDVNLNDEPVDMELSEEEATDSKKKKKKSKKKNLGKKDGASSFVTGLFDWASAFLFALIVVVAIMTFVFRLVDVDGDSMLNTLKDHDKLIVTGMNYEPQVGDVIVIGHGASLDKTLVKRVIAVSGQTVDINSDTGEVIVDGTVISESYINGKTTQIGDTEFPVKVEEGTVFVLGDNRPISKDSRFKEVGLIDKNNIIGKVRYRIYPLAEFGPID